MSGRSFARISAALAAFALGSVVIASDPAREKQQALLQLRLAQLQLQRTQQSTAQAPRPKGTKPAESARPPGRLPAGAIARLGDTRLRHAAPATCIIFSPESRQIITGGQDGMIRVWDVRTGDAVRSVNVSEHPTPPGSHMPALGSPSLPERLTSSILHPTLNESRHSRGSSDVFAVSRRKLIASIAANNTLTVSETDTRLPRLEIPSTVRPVQLPFSRTVRRSRSPSLREGYSLQSRGRQAFLSFDHGGPIGRLVVSGDGKYLATGGWRPGR